MQKIPKIIHQIWSGVDGPMPDYFKTLGDTWKRDYPDWDYQLWDNARMNDFVRSYYPQYLDIYSRFPYNVQRWDAIRYLILHKIGGMYVDFDYESVRPLDSLINKKACCFSQEPESHCRVFHKKVDCLFNNAMMLCIPEHPFMAKIIEMVFREETLQSLGSKAVCVLKTTGPWMLVDLYNNLNDQEKSTIYLIPAKYVTPLDINQAHWFFKGVRNQALKNCLREAYAVHYFSGGWLSANEK